MSIMDLFRGSSAAPAAEPIPANAAQNVQQPQPAQPGQMNQPQPAGDGGQPAQGLDKFADLFTPVSPEQAAKQPNFDPDALFATLQPDKVAEIAKSMNFAEGLTQDTLAAIGNGGEGAIQAFAAALNQVGQQSFTKALLASAQVTKQALSTANQSLDGRLSAAARDQAVKSAIFAENPALNSPAAKPIVDALQQVISTKNPTATSSEIQATVKEYLSNFAAVASGQQQQQQQQAAQNQETDWAKLFGVS